jgi:hypothetical protein
MACGASTARPALGSVNQPTPPVVNDDVCDDSNPVLLCGRGHILCTQLPPSAAAAAAVMAGAQRRNRPCAAAARWVLRSRQSRMHAGKPPARAPPHANSKLQGQQGAKPHKPHLQLLLVAVLGHVQVVKLAWQVALGAHRLGRRRDPQVRAPGRLIVRERGADREDKGLGFSRPHARGRCGRESKAPCALVHCVQTAHCLFILALAAERKWEYLPYIMVSAATLKLAFSSVLSFFWTLSFPAQTAAAVVP